MKSVEIKKCELKLNNLNKIINQKENEKVIYKKKKFLIFFYEIFFSFS